MRPVPHQTGGNRKCSDNKRRMRINFSTSVSEIAVKIDDGDLSKSKTLFQLRSICLTDVNLQSKNFCLMLIDTRSATAFAYDCRLPDVRLNRHPLFQFGYHVHTEWMHPTPLTTKCPLTKGICLEFSWTIMAALVMDYLGFIILLLAPKISQAIHELCTLANKTGADQHFCFTT